MTDESSFWIRFVLAALATWRVTHLVASEDGPADMIARLRAYVGDSAVGRMLDCFGCLSLWVAIPMAFFVSREPIVLILSWLALSGAAFLLDRTKAEPLVVERSADPGQGDAGNGILRSEASGVEHTATAELTADR
jgi:uncharacterized protein DUF1360